MLRRVQCTFLKASWLAVVPLALVLVSCGGEGLTGPSAVEPVAESSEAPPPLKVVDVESGSADDGIGEAVSLCRKNRVRICYKGRNKWVRKRWVKAWQRAGATLGRCSRANRCPCFSTRDIRTAARQCTGTVNPTCSASGDQVALLLACDPGGTVPPGILGLYLTRTADGGYCSRDDASGSFTESPLSTRQYEACARAINNSGYCS
jgi:hypothetical protein